MVQQVIPVRRARLEPPVQLVLLALLDQPEPRVTQVRQVPLVTRGQQVPLATQVLRAQRARLVQPELRARRAPLDQQV